MPVQTPDSMDALLAALKAKEAAPPSDSMDDPTDPAAAASDPENPAEGAAENAQVVAILQEQYPSIYAKISKQVETDPTDAPSMMDSDPTATPPPDAMS